jgi:hypothetical protein
MACCLAGTRRQAPRKSLKAQKELFQIGAILAVRGTGLCEKPSSITDIAESARELSIYSTLRRA